MHIKNNNNSRKPFFPLCVVLRSRCRQVMQITHANLKQFPFYNCRTRDERGKNLFCARTAIFQVSLEPLPHALVARAHKPLQISGRVSFLLSSSRENSAKSPPKSETERKNIALVLTTNDGNHNKTCIE